MSTNAFSAKADHSSAVVRLVPLSHKSLIGIEGPDAVRFLQGQVTCDIRELTAPVTRAGAQCNVKGRMLSSFRVLQSSPETLLLRSEDALADAIRRDLGKYIVFSKAKLIDYRDDYSLHGLLGENAVSLVQTLTDTSPAETEGWTRFRESFFIRIEDTRIECWIHRNDLDWFTQQTTPLTQPAPADAWTLATIRAGFGEVHLESRELFTPQSLNYQLVGAISFRKGCYTGQEIVARLHYKATLKRHMYRVGFTLNADSSLPAPGSAILNGDGKPIGDLVMAASSAHADAEALVVIPDNQVDNAWIATTPATKLTLLELPYAFPREDDQ